jgi:CDP-diacylglycerol--serine O-phosphatidyltransferase
MKKKKIPLYKLFPSVITILALCMGITAIKYTFENNFEMAVIMVLVACVMDGLDGPSARFLKSASDFGAQLDSLCDLVNFGVAPAIIIYNWELYKIRGLGWVIVLIYASCTALRLARYNVEIDNTLQGKNKQNNTYFHGISSPCAAILALSPLISTFQLFQVESFNLFILGCFILFIALMMVSRIPTISTKAFAIKKRDIPFVMALFAILIASIFLMPWTLIPVLSIIYMISIPCTWYYYKKKPLCKIPSNNTQE